MFMKPTYVIQKVQKQRPPRWRRGTVIASHAEDRGSTPVATDLSRKNRQLQLHCQTLSNRCQCHRSSEMTILNGRPVSQQVWHVREPSLLNGHECRTQVKICSPSPAMVTSPYEKKILEWDEKLQTNKQTNKQNNVSYEYRSYRR